MLLSAPITGALARAATQPWPDAGSARPRTSRSRLIASALDREPHRHLREKIFAFIVVPFRRCSGVSRKGCRPLEVAVNRPAKTRSTPNKLIPAGAVTYMKMYSSHQRLCGSKPLVIEWKSIHCTPQLLSTSKQKGFEIYSRSWKSNLKIRN